MPFFIRKTAAQTQRSFCGHRAAYIALAGSLERGMILGKQYDLCICMSHWCQSSPNSPKEVCLTWVSTKYILERSIYYLGIWSFQAILEFPHSPGSYVFYSECLFFYRSKPEIQNHRSLFSLFHDFFPQMTHVLFRVRPVVLSPGRPEDWLGVFGGEARASEYFQATHLTILHYPKEVWEHSSSSTFVSLRSPLLCGP